MESEKSRNWTNVITSEVSHGPAAGMRAHAHGSGALSFLGIDIEDATTKIILVGGLAASAVVLAPVAIPYLMGEGSAARQIADTLAEECCKVVGTGTGLAGGIANVIENIPVVGTYLNTAGGENIMVPALTVLGSYGGGSLLSWIEQKNGGSGKAGAFVRTTGMVLGVVLALPAILPGIGHGVQFLSRLAGEGLSAVAASIPGGFNPLGGGISEGFTEAGKTAAKALGNTFACTSVATQNGIMGGASVMIGHLPCLLPAFVVSVPAFSVAASDALKANAGKTASTVSR